MVRMINILTLLQLVRRALLVFIPWMTRVILFMLNFMLTAVISFWGGIPRTTDRIANEWLDRAVSRGAPTQWDRQLYFTFRVIAFLMILLGWVILSLATVWIINLII